MRSGRQVGKSTVISVKAAEFALKNPKKEVLIIASVERQAFHIFLMVINYIKENYPNQIIKRPTMTFLELKNGAKIRCLPAGDTGYSIRGYTIHMLIADEAAFIKEAVWVAVTPMMATTKGPIILLSTPHGKEGYFYEAFEDETFTKFHVSSEDCPRMSKEFLEFEKKKMSKIEYAQEYLGEFLDELRQVFPDELIKKCAILQRRERISPRRDYFLGVDVAGMGEDESTFEILDGTDKKAVEQVENIFTTKTRTTDTTDRITGLEIQYSFNQIGIDDGGIGSGVFDQLLTNELTRRKIIALNNSARWLDRDKKKSKKLLKEDMYNNLLGMMERGEIKLLDDDEIALSLKSIQFNPVDGKYFGRYTHITEGLIRAAWCVKTKRLNIWIA